MQTVDILVIRHPDAENAFTVSAPAGVVVNIIDADLGSSFDGYPRDEDEADAADELADYLLERTAHLPEGNVVRAGAVALADEMREHAQEAREA